MQAGALADALAGALLGQSNVADAIHAMRELAPPVAPAVNSMCAALSSSSTAAHTHPERAPLPQMDGQSRVAEFIATRIVDMLPLVDSPAPPDILDAAHVRTLLTEPYGSFAACSSPMCMGMRLPGGFPLRQYTTPAQMAHYHATGQAPRDTTRGVCYLCHLSYAIAATAIDTTVSLPFFHAVNVPGGYVADALQQSCKGLLHPIRRFMPSEYHPTMVGVYEAVSFDQSNIVTEWTQLDVRGYWEDATLLFGTDQLPIARTIASPCPYVAAPALPSCEAVICRKLCAPGMDIEFSYIDSTSTNVFKLPLRLAATLGGIAAPPAIEVPADSASPQQYVWALTLRPLPESRAILLYLVACVGAHSWLGVARMYNLMPTQAATPVELAGRIERDYPLRTHMVLYLTLARCAEIDRLLAPGASEFGGVADGVDAVHAALATPGVVDQLRAYRDALQPLHALLLHRINNGQPVSDEYWWAPDGTELLPWLRWMPVPPPAFYVASDLVAYPPVVSVCPPPVQALNRLPGDGKALSYPTFDAARAEVPGNPAAPYWACPAGCTGTVWRTIVWRVNAAYRTLLATASELATASDGGIDAAENAVARALATMRKPQYTTAELVAAAPVPIVDAARVRHRAELGRDAQACKQVIASHVPLVLALQDAKATTDAAALSIAHTWAPRNRWAPEMMCAETMFAAPFYVHDFVATNDMPQTLYAWVLAAAGPTNSTDVVARWQHAASKSHEWREWSRQALYASLVGAYAHARNMVPFEAWISLRRRVWSDDVAALETERTLLLVLREHIVDVCTRMPATALGVRVLYPEWSQFVANTLDYAERMRTEAASGDMAAVAAFVERTYTKAAQAWPVLHRPPAPFPTMLNDTLRTIDIERGVTACLQHRCVLAASDLAPPHEFVRAIGAYVERELRAPGAFDPAWLRELGIREAVVTTVASMQAEYADGMLGPAAAVARARQLAAQYPDDYVRVAVFFAVLVPHSRRQLVPLDAATAARQRSVVRAGQTHCVVSSVQCCNTIRTFVVQDGANMSGTLPARLNLDTGRITCVPKRGGVYTKTRTAERNGSTAAVAVAMRAWTEGTGSREAVVERLGPYVTSLMRDRYRLSCAAMDIMTWPIVGAVFRQQNSDGSMLTCTLCPRCGNATSYSAAMFSSNMFSCGVCETSLRNEMEVASVDHCVFCNRTKDAVLRMARAACATRLLGAANDSHYVILDDSVSGVTPARRVWVCGPCNRPWLPMATQHFSLHELRWLLDNEAAHGGDIVNIIDCDQQAALLRELRRSRADPRVPTPMPKRVSLLGQLAQSRKRTIGSIKL